MSVDPWYRLDHYERAKKVQCKFCGAKRGDPCVAADGLALTQPHERRSYGAEAQHQYQAQRRAARA